MSVISVDAALQAAIGITMMAVICVDAALQAAIGMKMMAGVCVDAVLQAAIGTTMMSVFYLCRLADHHGHNDDGRDFC